MHTALLRISEGGEHWALTGIIQFARSPCCDTCMAPSMVRLMCPLHGGGKNTVTLHFKPTLFPCTPSYCIVNGNMTLFNIAEYSGN